MADRETMLLDAIEGMAAQFPVYYDDDVVSCLMSNEGVRDREQMLLAALVEMVDKCLDRYDDGEDTLAESAGAHAVAALADFGLMDVVNIRIARWTEAGKQYLAANMHEWSACKAKIKADAETKRSENQIRSAIERHERQVTWTRRATIAASIAAGSFFIVGS